jgi:hypothetical protein
MELQEVGGGFGDWMELVQDKDGKETSGSIKMRGIS